MGLGCRFHALSACLLILLSQSPAVAQYSPGVSIIALGDSLTAGGYNNNGWKVGPGYRWDLKKMESWVGVQLEFHGSLSDGPVKMTQAHEGYSGKRIDEIQVLSRGHVNQLKPDVILLMVGTNDAIQGYGMKTIKLRLSTLLAQIQTEMPLHAHILIGVPIPTNNPIYNRNLETLESEILELKKMKIPRITFLNFYRNAKFTPTDLIDGVHPTAAGNKKMADHWAKGLRCILRNLDCQFL